MNRRILGLVFAAFIVFLGAGSAAARTLPLTGPDGQARAEALGQYGPTTSRDTLWRVANKVRPDRGVTIYQVMVALFDANPHAFASPNFNSLEKGQVLIVPSRERMLSLTDDEARARARQDDQVWRGAQVAPPQTQTPTPEPKPQTQPDDSALQAELEQLRRDNGLLRLQLEESRSAPKTVDSKELAELRKELSDSVDELALMLEQNALLKRRLEQMNAELNLLQDSVTELQNTNRLLEQQLNQGALLAPKAVAPDGNVQEPEVPEPPSFWQNAISSPLLLILMALVPVVVILFLVYLWLNRGSSSPAATAPAVSKPDAMADEVVEANDDLARAEAQLDEPEPTTELDDFDMAAVQLDEDVAEEDEDGMSLEELLREQESAETESFAAPEPEPFDPSELETPDLTPDSLFDEPEQPLEPEPAVELPGSVEEDELADLLGADDITIAEEEPTEEAIEDSLFDNVDLDALLDETETPELSGESASADTAADSGFATEFGLEDSFPELADAAKEEAPSPFETEEFSPAADMSPEPVVQAEPVQPAEPAESFIDIDKLLEESDEDETEVEYPGVSLDMDPVAEVTDSSEDEATNNAKLDLARAYIEIEDKDSARALLKEVTFDGGAEQKREAAALLEQL